MIALAERQVLMTPVNTLRTIGQERPFNRMQLI